jgi:hypothetical protein
VRTEVRERGGGREADFHLTPLKAAEMFLASQVTNSSFSEVPRDTVTSVRRRRQRLSKGGGRRRREPSLRSLNPERSRRVTANWTSSFTPAVAMRGEVERSAGRTLNIGDAHVGDVLQEEPQHLILC